MLELELVLQPMAPTPSEIREVPLGGPNPVCLISIDMDSGLAASKVVIDYTGLDDPDKVAVFLRGLADLIQESSYDIIDANGSEHREPVIKPKGEEQ